MFEDAIERVGMFTRPVFTIARTYGSGKILPTTSTLFFVNEMGFAVTTKSSAKMIISAGSVETKYDTFKKRKKQILESMDGQEQEAEMKSLEEEYEYAANSVVQMKVRFVDCVNSLTGVQCRLHPKADLAIIKFEGFDAINYKNYAVFSADNHQVKPGKFLCRMGFPFPEFTNYMYNVEEDELSWTENGITTSPRFPSEGMVTRYIGAEGKLVGIEMSTPGLKGQNGGPLFDERGIVHGMQSSIGSLNLGKCIHGQIIKDFLIQEGIKFYTEEKAEEFKPAKIDLAYITEGGGRLQ